MPRGPGPGDRAAYIGSPISTMWTSGIVDAEDPLAPRLCLDRVDHVGARLDDGTVGRRQVVRLEVDVQVVLAHRPRRKSARGLVGLFEQVGSVVDREAALEYHDGAVILADRQPQDCAVKGGGARDIAHEHDCRDVPDLQLVSSITTAWSAALRSTGWQ